MLILAVGMLVAPVFASAQVEVGLDAGLTTSLVDDIDDDPVSFLAPGQWARVSFAVGEVLLVESILGFEYSGRGDYSESDLRVLPGVNYLFGERLYVRGEAGIQRYSESDTGYDFSRTQYGFGGGVGLRIPLGDNAMTRLEAAVDRWFENADDGTPAKTDLRVGVGISAIIT